MIELQQKRFHILNDKSICFTANVAEVDTVFDISPVTRVPGNHVKSLNFDGSAKRSLLQRTLVITTLFVTKDFAVKSNLLL